MLLDLYRLECTSFYNDVHSSLKDVTLLLIKKTPSEISDPKFYETSSHGEIFLSKK